MKPLLNLILFSFSIFELCQGQGFYVFDGKSVAAVQNKDPKDVQAQVQEWQLWLYKDGQPTGDRSKRWGLISGKSIESIKRQLEAAQQRQRASEKYFRKTEVDTYFNPYGPVALLMKSQTLTSASNIDAKKAPISRRTTQTLAERAFSLKGYEIVIDAYAVAADYQSRGVKYRMGGDSSQGGAYSDCSHFVNDVLKKA
jgi:cell wall-associated NlpC family hydrolase